MIMENTRNNQSKGFLTGRSIYLRGHERADLDTNWYQWFNDAEITRYMYQRVFPNTYEGQVQFYDHLLSDKDKIQLAIIHQRTGKLIGVISISNIDWVNRSGEIAVVIGEKEYQGHKHGLEAMALMMYHGFTKMNLNRIWAGQHIGLKTWKEALQKYLCFETEGTLRQAMFSDGQYFDVVIIGALAKDFIKRLSEKGNDPIAMLE
jgi:ribosomal-protein-alanine N-acetyltransferase